MATTDPIRPLEPLDLSPAGRYAAAAERAAYPGLTSFQATMPFPLDRFQIDACRAFEDGKSVLVCAPTGAGKTVVGEFAVAQALATGTKCFYTTPIKALSNQKFADLADVYGASSVGLVTGDSTVNSHAPILVMTTEVLRNMLYAHSTDLVGLSAVVLDEVHYLANKFRGAVWEEVILHMPSDVRLVGLSATVSNAEEFGDWIGTIRGETAVIVDEVRPVPLWQHMLVGPRLFDLYAHQVDPASTGETDQGGRRRVNPALQRAVARARPPEQHRPRRGKPPLRTSWRPTPRSVVVQNLDSAGLLPAIVFVFSRAGCDAATAQCVRAGVRLTDADETAEISQIIDEHTADLPEADLETLDFWRWRSAWERGVAAHHAGLLPAFKETVEELFTRGLVKVVFATETLALGINMPARTVVLERLVKFDGENHVEVTPGEYTQLTGRAGRRGIDVEGHAVVTWSPEVDPYAIVGLASTRTFQLKSSFGPTYNMVVNLVDQMGRRAAKTLLEQSFAQFQTNRAAVGPARQLASDEGHLAELLDELSCDRGNARQYAELLARLSHAEKSAGSSRRSRRGDAGAAASSAPTAADIRALSTAVRSHPVHQCPDRAAHLEVAHHARRLEKHHTRIRARLDNARGSMGLALERIADLLTERGYLSDDAATDAGRTLQRIWFDADLLAADCLSAGIWSGLGPGDIAALASGLVFESRRGIRVPARSLGGKLGVAASEVEVLWEEIAADEHRFGVPATRRPDFGFAAAVAAWARGASLADSLVAAERAGTELTAGDFVRWCRQVIDALDQISRAAPADSIPGAEQAVSAIRRGVVALGGG
ncbi:MAG: DEAD/DEAH box helicase [Nakamurella sp.]